MKRYVDELVPLQGDIRYVDTETNGLDFTRYKVWSFQIGDGETEVLITKLTPESLSYLQRELQGKLFVAHNARFDLQVSWTQNLQIGNVWCTRIMQDILHVGKNYDPSLKGVLKKFRIADLDKEARGDFYLDVDGKPCLETGKPSVFEESGCLWTPELIEYAFLDIEYLHEVYRIQSKEIERMGMSLLAKIENAYVKCAASIEYTGIKMDVPEALKFQGEMDVIANQKKTALIPKLETFYFAAARRKFDVDHRIYSEWKAHWEAVKRETNSMRDGRKLSDFAIQRREEIKKVKPFHTAPKEPFEFNVDSNVQLLMALNEAGVELETTGKNEMLDKSVEHPILAELLDYRRYEKLSQLLDIQTKVNPITGRLHPHITQIIATGRQSMSQPNLQQIPAKSSEGKRFRGLFVAKEGYKFVAADYAAIELVIAGILSKDKSLIHAIQNEPDLHCYTMGKMLDISPLILVQIKDGGLTSEEEMQSFEAARRKFDSEFYLPDLARQQTPKGWVKTLRDYTKTLTYGLIYGLSEFGLMAKFHCEYDVAVSFISRFFYVYFQLKSFIGECGFYAEKKMVTKPTPAGRIRYFQRPDYPNRQLVEEGIVRSMVVTEMMDFLEKNGSVDTDGKGLQFLRKNMPEVYDRIAHDVQYLTDSKYRELEKKYRSNINRIRRQAGNFPMQASSADITKYASVLYEKTYPVPMSEVRLVMTCHDELIAEAPEAEAEAAALELKRCMEKAAEDLLDVKGLIVVDPKISTKWEK